MGAVRRVLIQGGGIGGLTLAASLGRRGVEVDVVEAASPESVLGVGLAQPSNALAVMDTIGVRDACLDAGFQFETLNMWDPAGNELVRIPPPSSRYGSPSHNGISRSVLNSILRDAAERAGARIKTGVTIWDMTDDGDGVSVELATWTGKRTPPVRHDDSGSRYDLVVGFDGTSSRVREHLFGDRHTPTYCGSGIWRIVFPRIPEVDGVTLAVNGTMRVLLTPISRDLMYLGVVTPEPGRPRYDPEDFPCLVKERMAGYSGVFAELRDRVGEQEHFNYTGLDYVVVDEPWYRGRIAIAGDAAHTSTPLMAQGGAMAVEDAAVLAEELDSHASVDDALAAWYRRRYDRAMLVADLSLALLRQEQGAELSERDAEVLTIGLDGAQALLAQEAY